MYTLETLILSSHEDFSTWSTVVAGFDEEKNFCLCYQWQHDDKPKSNRKHVAVVHKDDAFDLSKRLHISLLQLPEHFWKQFGTDDFLMPSDVEAAFSDMLNYLLSQKTSYRMQ